MRFVVACLVVAMTGQSGTFGAERELSFERDVRPILKVHCLHCHGEEGEKKGSLDLRLKRLLLQGGDSGPAIVEGKPEESPLVARIAAGEMPPGQKKPVPAAELAVLKRWIAEGAKVLAAEPEDPAKIDEISPVDREYWAFQPIARPPVPTVKDAAKVATPVDAFLLAKIEQAGLGFAPEADRRTLARRAYFDLTGLPPTPEEIEAFAADVRPDAWEALIDRLLDSPRYGERWGRHWLDVAGYADSEGYTTEDRVRPHAYRYRDYVIRSFQADKPFHEFIVEQLAGDELVGGDFANLPPEKLDWLVATGFLRNAPDGTGEGVDQKAARNDVIAETIKIVSSSLLGITVGCAQCHSHKYDPVTHEDYHRVRALFEPAYDWKNWRNPAQRLVEITSPEDKAKAAEIEAQAVEQEKTLNGMIDGIVAELVEKEFRKIPEDSKFLAQEARDTSADKRTPEQQLIAKEFFSYINANRGTLELYDGQAAQKIKAEADKVAALRGTKPPPQYVAPLTEVPGQVPVTFLFQRGDPDFAKQPVAPGELRVLEGFLASPIPEKDASRPSTGRRLAYAKHLTSGKHPLVARVLVNRFWMHHFGKGIVSTPGEFGRLGDKPTHPELLDWLADDFMAGEWRLKRFHRTVMRSYAYRQASTRHPEAEKVDPDNRLLARMSVRRFEAEAIRDAMLAVSGQLDLRTFGPAVPVAEDENGQIVIGSDFVDGNGIARVKPVAPGDEFRRSVYLQVRRSRLLSVLDTFDLPTMEPNCEVRNSSTVTPQSLLLMNSDAVRAASKAFAERVAKEAGEDLAARVKRAWRLALGRDPSAEEMSRGVAFLEKQTAAIVASNAPKTDAAASSTAATSTATTAPVDALATLCQVLYGGNEFLYVD
jgi:hypothetical protein